MRKLNSLLNWLTTLNQTAKTAVLVVAASVLMFTVGKCQPDSKLDEAVAQYNRYRDSTSVLLRQSKLSTVKIDELEAANREYASQITQLNLSSRKYRVTSDSMRRTVGLLKDSLKVSETIQDTVEVQSRIILTQDSLLVQKDSLLDVQDSTLILKDSIIATTQAQLQISELTRLRLQTQLENLPKPVTNPDNWFWKFKKPTRIQVAVVSGLAGLVGGILLVK